MTGDEEDGSQKVGYAALLNTGPDRFMIGSGIYLTVGGASCLPPSRALASPSDE